MRTGFYSLVACSILLPFQSVQADVVDDRYIDQLVNGRLSVKKTAAESMYRTKESDRAVVDVAAEVLLQNYQKESVTKEGGDTYAWICKAIGASGDGRYKAAVSEVGANAENKKLSKYCRKAGKALPEGGADSYNLGGVKLAKYVKVPEPTKPQMDHLSEIGKSTLASGKSPFSLAQEGMSMEEVHDLVGYPTNTTSKMTGKAWIPFYKGGDSGRLYALYKGLGVVEYNRSSAYSSTWLVLSISDDNTELGYR